MPSKTLLITFLFFTCLQTWGAEVAPGILRTPDAQFTKLEGFRYAPNYLEFNGARVHFVDEGPRSAQPILLLHGLPTWGYLFRKMLPTLIAKGHRVIVPDLIGFGRSDKFLSKEDYSYVHHIETIKFLVQSLDLREATFFGQDWGGMIGLRVVAEMPERFERVAVSNTGMVSRNGVTGWLIERFLTLMVWWNGPISFEDLRLSAEEALAVEKPSRASGARMFTKWMAHSYYAEDLDVVGIIKTFGRLELTDEEARAYEAPYPSAEYKAGVSVMASLIPTQLPENEYYWREVYEHWEKPFLVAFGSEEKITIRMKQDFMKRIPNPIEADLQGVGHFCQEEAGPQLAHLLDNFIIGALD